MSWLSDKQNSVAWWPRFGRRTAPPIPDARTPDPPEVDPAADDPMPQATATSPESLELRAMEDHRQSQEFRSSMAALSDRTGKLAESGVTALSVTSEIASKLSSGTAQAGTASAKAQTIAQLALETATSTKEIKAVLSDANALMRELAASAAAIGQARDEIAEIAATTRFLALNAQIESAHAGQYGYAFSVIATEVRKLSTKVGSASEVIGSRLGNVAEGLASSSSAVNRIDEMVAELEQRTQRTAEASTELSDEIATVDATITGINDSFEQVVNDCFADMIESSFEVQADSTRIMDRLP